MKNLHKYWGGIFLRGIVAIVFGLAALFWPALTLDLLVLFFGAFVLISGILSFFLGIGSGSGEMAVEGLLSFLIGLFIFMFTPMAVSVFVILLALWAMVTGLIEIGVGVALRKQITDELWMIFVGIISILFGLVLLFNPLGSAVAITFLIGIYAIVIGVFMLALSLKLKSMPAKSKKR